MFVACMACRARADVRADVEALGGGDRSAGSAGAGRAADYLVERLKAATDERVYRQGFLMALPVVEECAAEEAVQIDGKWVSMGMKVPIAPLIPSGGQAAALSPEFSSAELVYGGKGTLEELRGKDLRHRIVALEITSEATAWQTVASLGASAIVFLGDESTGNAELLNKTTSVPLGVPRFYCDDTGAAGRIREGKTGGLSLRVRVRWEEKRVENIVCVIPGKHEAGKAEQDVAWVKQAVAVQAQYDASSLVMGQAPGATEALNAALAVELAEKVAATPEHCTVVIALTAGDEWDFRGSRELLNLIDRDAKNTATAVGDLRALANGAAGWAKNTEATLAGVRRVADGDVSALQRVDVRAVIEDQLLRESSAVEAELQHARLTGGGGGGAAMAPLETRKQAILEASGSVHNRIAPSAAALGLIKDAAAAGVPRWEAEAKRTRDWGDALAEWPAIRAGMGDKPPMVWLTLSLGAGSDRFGFFSRSFFNREVDSTGPMSAFAQAFRRYAGGGGGAGGAQNNVFDVDSLENRFTLETFFPVARAFSSDAALAGGQPAGAFVSTQDAVTFLDTPNDLVGWIDWEKFDGQAKGLKGLLLGADGSVGVLTDPLFYGRADLSSVVVDQPVTVFERTIGETLPQVRAAGALVGGETESNGKSLGVPLVGTRRTDWYLADVQGNVTFEQALRAATLRTRMQAFEFDEDGVATRALAGNLADERGLVGEFDPNPNQPVRAMLFDCRRLDTFGLFDPRYLDTLYRIDVLDAKRLDAAEFSNVYAGEGAGGFAAVFMPPDIRWQLLAARGNVSNRMILINADQAHPTGRGFDTTDLAEIGPLPYRGALDFSVLNTQRQHELERFGVSNDVVSELQALSAKKRAEAVEAAKSRDYPKLFSASDALWALQSQVYESLIDTSNGIIKAVIFLLLGLIPFSYFVERLLIGSTSVYRQIAWFTAIFMLMVAALWFHPAFRISSAPLMILLAFLILILSSTVVYILWGKFEEEITLLQGAELSAHMTSLKRGAVFGAAIRLGLSNMRRRGARTVLTLITLILLTFTLLCFTSVREAVHLAPQVISFAGHSVPPPGILIRQRGWRALPPETLGLAQQIASDGPGGAIAGRWWYSSEHAERQWFIPVRGTGANETVYVSALVGLDAAEAQFQGVPIDSVLPGFGQLQKGEADVCWLSKMVQQASPALAVGESVNIAGHELKVAGFFEDKDFGTLRELTGDPMTPVDPAALAVTAGGAGGIADNSDAQSSAPETSYRFLSPQSVAVVPSWVVRELGGRLSSVMVRPDNASGTEVSRVAEDFARRAAFTVYVSDGQTVRSINAAASFVPRDFGDVLIPMLIGGMIVFNTMLGAVSERSREIHVYTSVGLAPAHVGMLFLAEAAALGTIGVVAGYIFGQGFATVLSWTHFLPDVALNYSSVSAIVTMGMVLGVVMLSALWPARAASRVAAPSLQRDWKLPKAVGDLLAVDLPFTVNETAARGVCAFVEEYLVSTSQSGTGHFTADHVKAFTEQTTQGLVRGLVARIWLAPYDLGVIQAMRLSIHPTDQHGVFDVHVQMTREAGNPGAWQRLNRPFLIDVRKQFLLWRNVNADLMKQYVERSDAMFAKGTK